MAGGNWKQPPSGGKSSQPTRGATSTSRRSWQPGAAAPTSTGGKRKSRFGTFLGLGIVAALLIAGIVIVLEMIKPPKFPILIVVAPNSPGSLAQADNVAGQNVAESLHAWAREGKDHLKMAAAPGETVDRDAWKTKLDSGAPSQVLYFTGHGGADAEGPYLWFVPLGERAPADGHKLRIKEVLDRLAGQPKEQPKLLVLDAARVTASWPHGAIVNDFARAVKELESEIKKIDNLAVIISSDEDQRSWVSEEWRQPVFGHFFLEGVKGAKGNSGDRITGDKLYDYVTEEVGKWTVANRDERQMPVLLPRESGRERASHVELAAVLSEGYKAPPTPEAPAKMPEDLADAWDKAMKLAERVPAPDTLDPARWREYLDLLLRWERLLRMGDDAGAVRGRVLSLARELDQVHGSEPQCLTSALPTGRALAVAIPEAKPDDLRRLWEPPNGSSRTEEWTNLLGPEARGETPRRVAMAALVLDRLVNDGPTPESLRIADEVLAVVDGPRLGTAEANFARMLHRNLDASPRPPVELLRAALALRLEAENAAWVGGLEPGMHPYSEQIFRWTRHNIEAGDEARELGQDLLFDGAPGSWKQAEQKYFPEARQHYAKAREDAKVIASALAQRDRLLSRLPYYARWAANYRGKRNTAEVESLLVSLEAAARAAHRLNEMASTVPEDPAPRITEILATSAGAEREFKTIVDTFKSEIQALDNRANPANWHALDNALTVPFIPSRDRAKLYNFARGISFDIATKFETGGTPAPAVPAQEMAKRQGRMALAMLGQSDAELRQLVATPQPGAWWVSYRDAGERIGKRYRGLTDSVATENASADRTPTLRDSVPHLAKASSFARLADSAAPNRAGEPLVAEQRYWRHDFLLWQAGRTIRAGWADVSAGPPEQWYSRKAATQCIETAKELIRGSNQNLSPDEADRRLADCQSAMKLEPSQIDLNAPSSRELADELGWTYDFTLTPKSQTTLGYPVYWLKTPGAPYHTANPALEGRKLESRFVHREPRARLQIPFGYSPRDKEVTDPGKLITTVLYRGHRYVKQTEIRLAGTPTLDWRYLPPKGPAAMAVLADRSLVTGALTILIDVSDSMKELIPGTDKKRITEAHAGLEALLRELPPNTTVTIARFWGTGTDFTNVEPVPGLQKIVWRGPDQLDSVMKIVQRITHVPNGNTPLARSVRRVLSKEEGRDYWPPSSSGTRTLVVLTDGVDNFDGAAAGRHVVKTLLESDSQEDTSLHLVLFGMVNDEELKAIEYYKTIKDPAHYRESGRTPAEMWPGVRDAKSLAEKLRAAMLPRVSFRREETAGVGKQFGRVQISQSSEKVYRTSAAMLPGVYDLGGLRAPQKLRVDPGDRVLLKARRLGDTFDLYIPPFAHELADVRGLPRATSGEDRNGIHLTIVDLKLREMTSSTHLHLVATMEPVGGSPASPIQELPRPLFPWFEVNYADEKPAEARLKPGLIVLNRPGLVAAAWDLRFKDWDVIRSGDTARRPAVSGYWIEGRPPLSERYAIDLRNPEQSAAKLPKISMAGGKPVELISASIEDVDLPPTEAGAASDHLPPGKYLTVRLKYAEAGQPVFLRPGNLTGTEQRYRLAERHLIYDNQTRYTARFGPLNPRDLEGAVELELYSVPELKKRAVETSRAATIRFPEDRRLNELSVPDELRLEPAKSN